MRSRLALVGAGTACLALALVGFMPAAQAAAPAGIGCVGAAPTGVTGSPGPGAGEVSVDWNGDPSCDASNYEVRYRLNALGSTWSSAEETGSPWSYYVVSGLTGGQSYVFQVRAFYGSGYSDWSNQSAGVTALSATPSAPTNLRAVGSSSSSITLSWTAASPSPASYQVQFRADRLGASWQPTKPLSTAATTIQVTDLSPDAGYFFQVRSSNGGSDVSSWVQTTSAVSPSAAPAKPTSVTATAGDGQLAVTWLMPLGSTATGYQIQYSTDGGTWQPSTPINTGSTTPSYVLNGLTNGVGYYVRVRALNGSAASDWTATTSPVTPAGVPAMPTSVSAVPGNGLVNLSWTAPASAGSPVTGYKIQYSSNGGASWTPGPTVSGAATTAATVTGLANGTGYTFQVRATSAAGDGPWSAPTATVTPQGQTTSLRITDSGRDGVSAYISGTASGLPAGTTLSVMVRQKAGGKFSAVGQITVDAGGAFEWSSRNSKKIWVYVMGGGLKSNTVTIQKR